jgi:phosphatidylglycerol:prolipoprotein diacylglycerol transferase
VILGGRLGWILFYSTKEVLADPLMILRIWEGGMSFHGGLLGALLAVAIFAARRRRHIGDVFDFMAPLPGLGILAGRIGNFINGELWGKPTSAPWGFSVDPAVLHPMQAAEARRLCERFSIDPCVLQVHASQLYEGLLEGLLLFVILWVFTAKPRPRLAPSGLFLICYGVFRFIVEFVRVPDENRGYLLLDWVTMGQILSTPMIIAGLVLLAIAYRRNQPSGNLQLQTT